MNKVICDVCGTDYPETAAQCPICGCATAGGQTSAGTDAAAEEGKVPYTYVKGGRFSKANVRKRLKANQLQESRIIDPEPKIVEDEDDEEGEEEELDEAASNRGLIIIIVLLLLAIISVSVYIAISIFGWGFGDKSDGNQPIIQNTSPSTTLGDTTQRIACTSLTLRNKDVLLETAGATAELVVTADPANTTDTISFTSSDESVAVVDAVSGRVTAVGQGQAVITVQCGDVTVECPVECVFVTEPTDNTDEVTDPTDDTATTEDTDPTEPEDTTAATEDVDGFVLKLKKTDFTLFSAGETYAVYNGEVAASKITWSSANEDIASIKNGVVTAEGPGRTRVFGEYNGQKVECWVSCRFKAVEETDPTESTEATEPTDETQPTETEPTQEEAESYVLRKNGKRCTYGDDYHAEATIVVGETFKLAVVDSDNNTQKVTWSASKDGICTVSGTTVTGAAAGTVTLTATYEGTTFQCIVIVR